MSHPFRDKTLLLPFRIVDFQFEDETVDLRLRQRICPFLFDRVLCGENQERIGHFEGLSRDGRLFLLHALQKGALHFRRRPVDLVRQHNICKHGSLLHRKAVFGRIVDAGSDYVRGKKIRRELNPGKGPVQALGKRFDRKGLGQTGKSFQKNMPVGQHRRNQTVDQNALTRNDPAHLRFQGTDERRGFHYIILKFL